MGEKKDDNSSNWTEKRLHNKNFVRSGIVLGVATLAGYSSSSSVAVSSQARAVVHLLTYGTCFGTMVYTTFVAGITMFHSLPRRSFGMLQAKLFPRYFKICSTSLVLQLFTLSGLSIATKKSKMALGSALAMMLLNQFYLEPVTTANMMERYRLEDEAGTPGKPVESKEYKDLKAKFGMLHGFSSLANLISLCGCVAHAVFMAPALVQKK